MFDPVLAEPVLELEPELLVAALLLFTWMLFKLVFDVWE